MIMNHIYMRHKNDRRLVLLCDKNYNPISEEYIGKNEPRSKAFYVGFCDGFIGVYSSVEGPVLFINDCKYLFADPSWNIRVQKNLGVNEVSFVGLDQSSLVFEYSAVELDPLDPWSEEQFDDFFIWLTNKRHDQEFIEMWTERK